MRTLALVISRRSMLGECQGAALPFSIQRMCRSRRIPCSSPYMVYGSTFLLNIVWTFGAFHKKNDVLSRLLFFLWDLFAAEASVKRERLFGTPVLYRSIKIRVERKTLMYRCLLWWTWWVSILNPTDPCRFCLIACLLCCISLALGASNFWFTILPSGPSGERTPFRFLECDVQGGDANQIQGADVALAWMFSQLPFVSEKKADMIVSLSWPTNMEAQDLYPSTSSTYTFPTGTTVDVPCSGTSKVVEIELTKCPDSFISPMDPNHDMPCVKVLHGSTLDVYIR
jgi:hypothetical protein